MIDNLDETLNNAILIQKTIHELKSLDNINFYVRDIQANYLFPNIEIRRELWVQGIGGSCLLYHSQCSVEELNKIATALNNVINPTLDSIKTEKTTNLDVLVTSKLETPIISNVLEDVKSVTMDNEENSSKNLWGNIKNRFKFKSE